MAAALPRHRPRPAEARAIPAFFLYGEPLRAPDEGTVHIETIEARSRLHHWKIRPHRHRDLHQVLIFWRGVCEARFDDQDRTLSGPALLVIPQGTVHSFSFSEDTDGLVISFAASLAREIFRTSRSLSATFDQPFAVTFGHRNVGATEIRRLGTMLLREFTHAARGRDLALHGLLSALLANIPRLAHSAAVPSADAANRARELVARFRDSIEQHYRVRLSLGAHARALGTTEAALRRACRLIAGQSPLALLHSRLLIEAERQLRYTGMRVTQIAYLLGFEDPAYFTRFFTKRTGIAPAAWRRRGAHTG